MKKISIAAVVMLLLLAIGNPAKAQNKISIRLLDKTSYLPVIDAAYTYGNQSGISNEDGIITFHYNSGTTLEISHISYGLWTLGDHLVLEAIRTGIIYREMDRVNLYPVTVISLREKEDNKIIKLDYEEKLAHDAGAILNQSPAINSIRKSGNYGFDPVLRGFKYDQLNIVLNGAQSAVAACPNRMDPPTSQMAPNMMDRIEVLKGPHALRYGTGVGGTINFVPTRLRFSSASQVYGRISGAYENNGNLLRSEALLGFSGTVYDIGVYAAWSTGDDYQSGNETTIPADFMRASFGLSAGFKLNKNQQIRATVNRNIARDTDFPALPMDLRDDDTWMFNVRHDVRFNRRSLTSINTTIFGSFVDHRMDNLLKPLEPRMVNASTDANTYNYGGRVEGNWKFGGNSLFAGADAKIEGARGIRTREFLMGPNAGKTFTDNAWQDSRISRTALFTEYHISKGLMDFILSGRMEVNHAEVNDPADEYLEIYQEPNQTQFNPSISFGAVRKFQRSSVSLWLGRAQRSGSLTERYINYFPVGQDPYELVGNPDLKPESNNQVDLVIEKKTDRTTVSLDIFGALLQNYITSFIDGSLTPRLPNSPGVRRFTNIDEAVKAGFEITWIQKLPANMTHQMGIAYTYGQDVEREEPLPEIAPLDFRYSLQGSYINDHFKPEIQFRYVLEQNRISEEFGETTTPGFALLDIKLTYQASSQWHFTGGINNIFNRNYYEHLNRSVRGADQLPLFAPGRNIFISFNYSFN